MALSGYQRMAYRLLGPTVSHSASANVHLRLSLQKAHIYLRPEVYLAYSYFNMAVVFGATMLLVAALAVAAAQGFVAVPPAFFVILVPLPIGLSFVIYLMTFLIPDMRASTRARDIDARLPYALNYIATMSSAGITPEKVFASLSRQHVYGEVANEAAWIARDIQMLGRDLNTALIAAIDRSPSVKFQDLLQGAITALSSGENLKDYFLAKSEQFVFENRQGQKKFLENLAVLAESYVTVVVAGPLFIIILLTVMLMFGGSGTSTLDAGYLLVFGLLPLSQFGFGMTIKLLTPEV